ncbi:MAG TPA: hypothetical protein PKE40_05905 [Arachnia sp.]|nr:hypothetical protein [Arachnia sp.]HMT85870.1 hypothetical protein [Arachnia sp.]
MKKPSGGVRFLAGLLLVLGALGASASLVAIEARQIVADPDLIVAAAGPLARDPEFQETVVVAISTPVVDAVRDALPLSLPGLEGLVASAVGEVVSSEQFASLWEETLRVGHAQLTRTLTRPDEALFTVDDAGVIQLQLRPIVATARQQLVETGVPLADRIPDVEGEVRITQSDLAARVPGYLVLLDRLAVLLPWVSGALLAVALLLPGWRLRRLGVAGFLVALSAVGVIAGIGWASRLVVGIAARWAQASTIQSGLDLVTASLRSGLWWMAAIGAVVGVVAWIASSRSGGVSDH